MALQYIDPALLDIDEIVEMVIDRDTMDQYYDRIDKKVRSLCQSRGVPASEIPVDGSGYVTSLVLEECAMYYGMMIINLGYFGSGNGSQRDVYWAKYQEYKELYRDALKDLTKETIEGGDGETDLPANAWYQSVQIQY